VSAPQDPGRATIFLPSFRRDTDGSRQGCAAAESSPADPPPARTSRVDPQPLDADRLEHLLRVGRSMAPAAGPAASLRVAAATSPALRQELSAALAAQGLDETSCAMLRSSVTVIVLGQPAERQERGSCLVRAAARIANAADALGLTALLVVPADGGVPLPRALAGAPGERADLLIVIGPARPPAPEAAGNAPCADPEPPPGGGEPSALLLSFLDIAEAAAAAQDIDHLLRTIAGVLGRLFPVEGASLALREEGGIVVREIRPGGETAGAESRWLPDEETHMFGWVSARDRPLWRNDIAAELRFAESVPGDGMLSDMVIPLRARGRTIGAFRISSRIRHAFEPEDFHLLERCADLTAVAVENQRLLQRTRRLSEIDGLTGVTNHRHFVELLGQEVERASRAGGSLSLLMADIDDFKSINDTHGHPAGDAVLRHVAQVLAGLLRRTDVLARYGGEEFVALLPEAGPEPAARIAETMRAEVERRICASTAMERPLGVRISLGVATLPDDAGTAGELIAAADRGLYRAKREGKNRVRRA
jgi:diguanylate cyclase (GGDEF)-like protein